MANMSFQALSQNELVTLSDFQFFNDDDEQEEK